MEKRIITSYATFKFKQAYWDLNQDEQKKVMQGFYAAVTPLSPMTAYYQVYPSRHEFDFFVWQSQQAEELDVPAKVFGNFAKAVNASRRYMDNPYILCGITKPSIYSRAKSKQEIDPFNDPRQTYFVIYPFSKTTEWYLKTREERQEMMNDHIRIGKQYRDIKQLLLYSFGIQDQEFVVAYEMEDLPQFSDLVQELRSTKARDYTLLDTPIITGVHRTPEELAAIFTA